MRLGNRGNRRRLKELSLWMRELGLMLRNGTDLWSALSVLERQDFSRDIRAMTGEMVEKVSLGAALEDLLGSQNSFPLVVRFALGSGRAGGRIPETLLALADALDQAAELGMALSDTELISTTDAAWVPDRGPVVRLVDKLLWDAAQQRASEIRVHAAEGLEAVALDFRIRGEWRTTTELPADLLGPICRRLCIMAGINWALKQPALGTLRVGERETDVRGTVQFIPGESERDHEVRITLAEVG